ncbi:hypothetical protein [Actinoplanes sp. NPDC049599]|uniref:hypothetical protein n=1 Tax=Actinoplanes sp. NPDC049599 TaxID=3363903 RepID=UPI00378DAC35
MLLGARGPGLTGPVPQATQALGVTARQPPIAMALMRAPEFVALGRIIAGCRPVTHGRELGRGEELKLPHTSIILLPTDNF